MGAPPPFGSFGPPPQRKSRKPLVIALCIAGVIVLVVGVVLAITLMRGGSKGSAGDAVKGYLDALARGDADGALSYSNEQAPSKDLLTADILKKQNARWPITNIKILSDDSASSFGFARVHVTANFGDKMSDETLSVKNYNGDWKLEHAAVKVDTTVGSTANKAAQTLTFFGKPAKGNPVYVFPGWTDIASSNANVKVTSTKPILLDGLTTTGRSLVSSIDYALSETGQKAVMSAIAGELAACTRTTSISPPDCPFTVRGNIGVVDGTASWGPPDLSDVKIGRFDQYQLNATFSGEVYLPVTAKTIDGGTKQGVVRTFLSGTSDLQSDPATIKFR